MGLIKKNLVTGCWLWSSKFDETKKSKASRTKVQSDLARISYGKQCSVYVSDPVRNRRTMSVRGPSHSNGSQFKVISISFFFRKMLYLSFCLSAMLSLRPYIPMTMFLSVHLSDGPSVHLSVCPSVSPSVHLSVCPSFRPSVFPSVRPSPVQFKKFTPRRISFLIGTCCISCKHIFNMKRVSF